MLIVLSMVFLSSGTSLAALTYIISGVGSGSLGDGNFSDTTFTITATADPANVVNPRPAIYSLEPVTAVINILGVGTATFDIPANLAANQSRSSAGIGDPAQGYALFFVVSAALASYDLTTPLDTVTGGPNFNPDREFPTTSGPFVLTSATSASFQVIPEPSSSSLMLITVLMMAKRCRTRRRS